jgi:prepilin-type N-terminal cleavage/methylation domain-containing protein
MWTERRRRAAGFTLVEMIVVVFLLAIAMLGLLAVFDASTRINKSEQEVADAQGSVRYGIYQMTRVIRMAGAGGLYVTQAVLVGPDADLPGITAPPDGDYDNVLGGQVTNLAGAAVPIRPGTDVIEVRGVILSPLVGFDLASGCGGCTGNAAVTVKPVTLIQHVNDDAANRPQFSAIDSFTGGASAQNPMYVLVAGNDDVHAACSDAVPGGAQRYPQPTYNVGVLKAPTSLVASGTFGNVDFSDTRGREFATEDPGDASADPSPIDNLRRAGILDDIVFFIDNTDPYHPVLAQGIRRGNRFDVVTIADDVEDMQVAYGVDGRYGSDGVGLDNAVGRVVPVAGADTDPTASTQADGDEWAPNVQDEIMYVTSDFQSQPQPVSWPHAGGVAHCPTLHGVMISLVAKSRDPDPTYRAAGGASVLGIRTMNSPPDTSLYPSPPESPRYRRRIQTLKINLRNYSFPG